MRVAFVAALYERRGVVATGLWPVGLYAKEDRPQGGGYSNSRTQLIACR